MTMTDPMTTVRQYIDGFNRGDSKAMAAAFADPGWILDGIAPHVWHGPTAAQDWYRDMLVEAEHLGASGFVLTLGESRHVDVTGDSAYVVVVLNNLIGALYDVFIAHDVALAMSFVFSALGCAVVIALSVWKRRGLAHSVALAH